MRGNIDGNNLFTGIYGMVDGWLKGFGIPDWLLQPLIHALLLAAVLAVLYLLELLIRVFISRVLERAVRRSSFAWDDALMNWKTFHRLSVILPLLILYKLLPYILGPWAILVSASVLLLKLLLVYYFTMLLDSLINVLTDWVKGSELSEKIPHKVVGQVLKMILYFVAVMFALAVLLKKSPLVLMSGLGAMTAVLMLVFRDSLLGFVAGIQLVRNKMVSEGDWIEMPRYNADGDVIDIALTTVKVRNWDKTVTTIPSYALISDSFKNWKSMPESGGRRIKRAVHIDLQSVGFVDQNMLKRYEKLPFIGDYIRSEMDELSRETHPDEADRADLIKGLRLTNLGVFRAYVKAYLMKHPRINTEMTLLVRQLAPGSQGVPLEIYAFCRDTAWAVYEDVQADIFDHIYAIIPMFDLKLFQTPSGSDIQNLQIRH